MSELSTAVTWVSVASTDDLWEGDVLDAEAEGEPVLLVHLLGGTVKALVGVQKMNRLHGISTINVARGVGTKHGVITVCGSG